MGRWIQRRTQRNRTQPTRRDGSRAKHASFHNDASNVVGEGAGAVVKPCNWGINGITGKLVDMEDLGIWEPFSVKVQTIKTAIESACMILRIDDIVSGSKKGK